MRAAMLTAAGFCAALSAAAPLRAAPVSADHLEAELVAERSAFVPGATTWVGLRLRHDPHWHTYWINPGDSGLETRLKWTLPEGYQAGAIAWPAPRRLAAGELTNFGYVDEGVQPVPLSVPAGAKPGEQARLSLAASWLVCEDVCIPGKATLALDLPVRKESEPDLRWQALFAQARATQPVDSGWRGEARIQGGEVVIALAGAGLPTGGDIDLFAVQGQVLESARPEIEHRGERLVARAARSVYLAQAPGRLDLVLTRSEGDARRAWRASVPLILAGPDPAPH
jgi:thiol:disulfide interchange protein DsbD